MKLSEAFLNSAHLPDYFKLFLRMWPRLTLKKCVCLERSFKTLSIYSNKNDRLNIGPSHIQITLSQHHLLGITLTFFLAIELQLGKSPERPKNSVEENQETLFQLPAPFLPGTDRKVSKSKNFLNSLQKKVVSRKGLSKLSVLFENFVGDAFWSFHLPMKVLPRNAKSWKKRGFSNLKTITERRIKICGHA